MYHITRINRGKQVIESRNKAANCAIFVPTKTRNISELILNICIGLTFTAVFIGYIS